MKKRAKERGAVKKGHGTKNNAIPLEITTDTA